MKIIVISIWSSYVFLLLLITPVATCAQETPQLDTLTLGNGLKMYLLPYGEAPTLSIKLVINGGRKNETECQVGYSRIIQQLLEEALKESYNSASKKKRPVTCEIRSGQTIISSQCSNKVLKQEMQLLGTTITRLSFQKRRADQAVSKIIDRYTQEHLSEYQLSRLFTDLLLYGPKHPLGRSYCQYQIQKALPEELRAFYSEYYTAKQTSLLICGNFNTSAAKKIIETYFGEWRTTHSHKGEPFSDHADLKIPKIKNREIGFVNKPGSPHYLLNWVLPAPSTTSSEHTAFLIACHLFDQYLYRASRKKQDHDTLRFNTTTYTTHVMEMNCIEGKNELVNAIQLFDTSLQAFSKLKISGADLEDAVNDLNASYNNIHKPDSMLAFYDPLLYNFTGRKNYSANLSAVAPDDLQAILKKYFNPNAYKLIIVGDEHAASNALSTLKNVTRYQTMDFETCDASCVPVSKKKWKKGHYSCCWHCFIRGWCPCIYSPARLQ